jgi:hypothetical protein
MRIVSASRCSILLSLKEGANRALAESMFCNVPVILLEEHVGGIRKNVVPESGMTVRESELSKGIELMLNGAIPRSPRQWALQNISCVRSTRILNDHLVIVSKAQGERWSRDIVVRCNSPESTYYDERDALELEAHSDALRRFLRGDSRSPLSL